MDRHEALEFLAEVIQVQAGQYPNDNLGVGSPDAAQRQNRDTSYSLTCILPGLQVYVRRNALAVGAAK